MYRLITILSLITLTMLCVTAAYGQPFPPAPSSDGAPIDGLVSVMLLAGVGYGVYRLKEKE